MNNVCVVNYVCGGGWRPFGQERLHKSLTKNGFQGDILTFQEESLKCPPHSKNPYAFKLYALMEAYKKGYDVAVWLDASFWAIRPIEGLLEFIDINGTALQNSGYFVGQWCGDSCLTIMGINREQAFLIPMFSGGLIGVNFNNVRALEFFKRFHKQAQQGQSFLGAWNNKNQAVSSDPRVKGHRHDMPVGSIITHELGISLQPNNSLFSYYGWYKQYRKEKDLDNKIYFAIEGGMREIE
jgi:hypothetical protein